MTTWPAVVTLAALVSQAPPAPPQTRDVNRTPLVGTARVTGTVTADEAGGAPVRQAVVRITVSNLDDGSTPAAAINRAVVTDDRGRYVIADLPSGRFYLAVDKAGWVSMRYGAQTIYDAGTPIAVTDGQATSINMKLARGAVIAGRVVDEQGVPQPGVRPVLLQYRTVSGQQRLVQYFLSGVALSRTNDLGEYRLYGIPPGSYVVAIRSGFAMAPGTALRVTTDEDVTWARQPAGSNPSTAGAGAPAAPAGRTVMFAPIYHPGVTDVAAAVPISLAAGEQRLGVDLVTMFVPTAQVRGVVLRPDGQPAAGARLTIARARAVMSSLDAMSASATADAKGAFSFGSVATGDFVINARAASQTASAAQPGPARPAAPVLDLWGTTPVTLDGREMTGVTVTLQQGMTVTGRLMFESVNNTTPPALAGMRMMMTSAAVAEGGGLSGNSAASLSMSPANADGTFAFRGLAPGRYSLSASGPGLATAWMQKAVMVNGRNAWDTGGFEIRAGEDLADVTVVMTDQVGEISGTLLHADGRPAPEVHVLVFPTDKTRWTSVSGRMRPPARPASDGRYRVTSLQPGDYYVAALSRFDPANLFDTAFLEQVAAAAFTLTLAEGEKKVQDIKIK
jgi:hypothetical protein